MGELEAPELIHLKQSVIYSSESNKWNFNGMEVEYGIRCGHIVHTHTHIAQSSQLAITCER